MEEEGRGAGRGERGGDLLQDQAALAHAGADHPAGAALEEGHGAVESLVELGEQTADRRRLGLQDLGGDLTGRAAARHRRRERAHNFVPSGDTGPGVRARRTARSEASSRSARSGSSCTAASERAWSGSGWTSRKTPSAPAATAALASGSA